jgi:membrane-bound lytic murein transglycosylase D
MKACVALCLLLAAACLVRAQTNEMNLDVGTMLDTAQQWAQDNLDEDVLAALQSSDRQKVASFLENYNERLQGDYVLDVAQLKDVAISALPLLDSYEETAPYAAWLRARMDYFEVASELKTNLPPVPPSAATNLPPVKINPSFAQEEEIWIKKVAPRPWPRGADKLVPQLKKIFTAERVPAELVWMAEVESGFDRRAESPAGAVGIYQLMPATAKSLGLSLWPFDQRKQTEPAARAAAKYLRYLHGKFGDWRLALAAYNCGEGNLRRLMQRHNADSYAAIATRLPAETQMYVPKVAATIQKREGVTLGKLKAL